MNVLAVLVGLGIHVGIPAFLLWRLFGFGENALLFVPTMIAGAVGWNFLVAQAFDTISVSVDHRGALVADVVLAATAFTAHRRRTAGTIERRGRVGTPAEILALAAAAVVVGVMWMALAVSSGATPPYQDSVHHGYMTRKIAELQTVDPEAVGSLDADGTVISARYYPLGLHTTTALAHQTTGARIDHLLFGWVVIAGAVIFPLGSLLLTRALVDDRLAGAIAAFAAVCFAEMPYLTYAWGGLPTIVGTALAPGVAVGIAEATRHEKSFGLLMITALAFAGLFVISNNLVFLPALLAACLVFREPGLHGARELRRRALRLAIAASGTLVLLIPSLQSVLHGAAERYVLGQAATGKTSELLADLATGRLELGKAQITTSTLAAVGLTVLAVRKRWGLVAVTIGIVALATVAWSPNSGVLANFAFPWYRSAYRIAYLLTVVKAIAAGVGAVALFRWSCATSPKTRVSARVAVVGLVVVSVGTIPDLLDVTSDRVTSAIDSGVVINQASRRAFGQLRQQNGQTATVVGEYCDQSTWMYAFEGVPPLFGVLTPDPVGIPEMAPRLELLGLLNAGGDPRTLSIARELDLRWLYFGERSICPADERFLSLNGLRANQYLRETFDDDGIHIFEIPPGPANE